MSSGLQHINTLSGSSFRLLTLGRMALLDPAGAEDESLTKRRRKLALLAVLALSKRPLTRDQLIEMFWGDQDEIRARHSLSDTLSHLRRVLGRDAIATRQAEVALGDDVRLCVDAVEMTTAVAARDFERAVALYGGPFLDGVFVGGSSNFESFVEHGRHRLETLFLQAAEQQAQALARTKRWDECAALAARWLDASPLSSEAAIARLNAICAPATRDADQRALDAYERLAARLVRDYDRKPDRAVAALAREIAERLERTDATGEFHVPDSLKLAEPIRAAAPPARSPPVPPATANAPPHRPQVERDPALFTTTSTPIQRRRRRLRFTLLGAMIGVAATVGGIAIVALARSRIASDFVSAGQKPSIAIVELRANRLDSNASWLVEGLDQMIAAKLARTSDVDVVAPERVRDAEPRAGSDSSKALSPRELRELGRSVGATWVVSGSLTPTDSGAVLNSSVLDVSSGKTVRLYSIAAPNMIAIAEQTAVRLLSLAGATGPGPRLSDVETSNLDAYDHFARFVQAQHEGRIPDQVRELDAAIALDSGFVSALRERINLGVFLNDQRTIDQLTGTFHKYESRATPWDRAVMALQEAFHGGERARAETLASDLVARFPRDPRAYWWMQNVYSHHAKWAEAETAAMRQLALDSLGTRAGRTVCVPCEAYGMIAELRWIRGDVDGAERARRRLIELEPDLPGPWVGLGVLLSGQGRHAEAIQAARHGVALSAGDPDTQAQYVRILLAARRYESADSLIRQWDKSNNEALRERAFDLRFTLEREQGRYRASNRTIHQMVAMFPDTRQMLLVEGNNLGRIGDYAGAIQLFESLHHTGPVPPTDMPDAARLTGDMARAFCWQHALEADAIAPSGDTTRLRALADSIEMASARSYYGRDWVLHHHVRALIALRGKRYEEAEREFTAAQYGSHGWTRNLSELAQVELHLGKPAEAIALLRRAYLAPLDAMGRYEPHTQLDYWMARAFAAAGQHDSAAVYTRYVQLAWRDADPEVRAQLR